MTREEFIEATVEAILPLDPEQLDQLAVILCAPAPAPAPVPVPVPVPVRVPAAP